MHAGHGGACNVLHWPFRQVVGGGGVKSHVGGAYWFYCSGTVQTGVVLAFYYWYCGVHS